MEQEPVYVPSGKLVEVCEDALGKIYERRQSDKECFVRAVADAWNAGVVERNNQRRFWIKWLGRKAEALITPQVMEAQLRAELQASPDPGNHPLGRIECQYGQLEHEAKDAMVMARMADSVPVSASFCRGLSHLEVNLEALKRPAFGFLPR